MGKIPRHGAGASPEAHEAPIAEDARVASPDNAATSATAAMIFMDGLHSEVEWPCSHRPPSTPPQIRS
jgi:hypothetical protein